jgi:hypothetical protein
MKKSYIKVILFELFCFIVLILNSYDSSILRNYKMSIFIILLVFIFKIILGFEKDKNRYVKDIILNILIDLTIYFIIYYLFGIIIGFAKNTGYLSLVGLFRFIIHTTLTIVLKEYLRYGIITKTEKSTKLLIITTILFILFDISSAIAVTNFSNSYSVLSFLALTLLPSIYYQLFLILISI